MKVRVIRTFRDKHTKVVYQKGQEIEVTKERFEEINSTALGPFVEQIKPSESLPAKGIVEGKKPKSKTKK
jgi:hypothetical protein